MKSTDMLVCSGLVVWLDVPPAVIAKRLVASDGASTRPLLRGLPEPINDAVVATT